MKKTALYDSGLFCCPEKINFILAIGDSSFQSQKNLIIKLRTGKLYGIWKNVCELYLLRLERNVVRLNR